jgi:uncharacterized protein YaeQ
VAAGTVLYHFTVDLSDVPRGLYLPLDMRPALHPSEDLPRLIARCLAYCLLYEPDLSFGRGLSDADEPALVVRAAGDRVEHWVDVGTPGADRIHRASKLASHMTIVSHKGAEGLRRERERRQIHAMDRIRVLLLEPDFVEQTAALLQRNDQWVLVRSDLELMLSLGGQTLSSTLVDTTLNDV